MNNRLFFLVLLLAFLVALGTFRISREPTLTILEDLLLIGFMCLLTVCAIQKFHFGTVNPLFLAFVTALSIFLVVMGSSYMLADRAVNEAKVEAQRKVKDVYQGLPIPYAKLWVGEYTTEICLDPRIGTLIVREHQLIDRSHDSYYFVTGVPESMCVPHYRFRVVY